MSNKNPYIPLPIDTSSIVLSKELLDLRETIAENVHENWAATRLHEGWTWGPARNDTLKQHPCLIPYNELPEEEKEYDRQTALETLKTIIKLGWDIKRS